MSVNKVKASAQPKSYFQKNKKKEIKNYEKRKEKFICKP